MPEVSRFTLGLVVAAALLGGAAGAAATLALSSEPKSKKSAAKVVAETRIEADDALDERIARLEGELHSLKKRNTSTEALQKYARALNRGAAKEGKGVSDGDAADAGEGNGLNPVVDAEDPTFELAVRTVLDRVDWEREEERKVTRSKHREERAQRQTQLLAERLKLNPSQQQKVQEILTTQMETFRSLRSDDSGARPATRGEWRARVEAIRTETERKLAEVLDDGQMDGYRQFVEEEGFGAGRGRRGGGRGGGERQGPRSAPQAQ